MSQEYLVSWEIEVVAANPRAAAKQARKHQIAEGTTAVVFDVVDGAGELTRVDLLDLAEELYPYETWVIEVNLGTTRKGYLDWVESRGADDDE